MIRTELELHLTSPGKRQTPTWITQSTVDSAVTVHRVNDHMVPKIWDKALKRLWISARHSLASPKATIISSVQEFREFLKKIFHADNLEKYCAVLVRVAFASLSH